MKSFLALNVMSRGENVIGVLNTVVMYFQRMKGESMEIGDKVQVWSDSKAQCLGWGTIVATAFREPSGEEVPLIQLEKGHRKIWGNECYWIDEKKAIEIGLNVFKAIHEK